MQFNPVSIAGAYLIDLEKKGDERGFFARVFCQREFAALNLATDMVQINNSLSVKKGVLRGMHYQLPPSAEVKVLRCIRGALYDVVLDLRPDSPSFGQWFGAQLTAENRRMLYVPQGCAHGFLTLKENTEAFYMVHSCYDPEQERGVRFDDPRFAIEWPNEPAEISEKDKSWPDFNPEWHGVEKMRGLL